MKNTFFKKAILVTLSCLTFYTNNLMSQTQNYFGTSGDLNGASGTNWSTNPAGPYTSALVTTGGAIINFNNILTSNPVLTADILPYGINVTQNVTFSRTNGIIRNYNNTGNLIIDVSAGKIFESSAVSFSGIAAAGQTKNGEGVLVTIGGTFGGGYTLNAGTIIAKGVNAMGGNATTPGSLTINGGIIAANLARDFSGKYSNITIGGNFTLGSDVSPAVSTANLTFNTNTSLGTSTRTITIGGTGTYTWGGIISGQAGINVNANSSGVLLFSNPANSYTGTTIINANAELRINPSATNATFASQIDLAGGKLSTTGIATGTNFVSSSTLKLSDNSTIDLGTNVHSLTFSDSHSVNWTSDKLLTIVGWSGAKQTSGTAGKIYVGVGGLTTSQLSKICFKGFATGAVILSTGELVPSAELPPGKAFQHFIIYGQSLSVGYQSYPSLSVDNVPGNYMIGSQVWSNNRNTDLSHFQPLVSNLIANDVNLALSRIYGRGECSITSMVNHLQKRINNSENYVATSCGTGGKTIEELSKECEVKITTAASNNYSDTTFYTDFSTAINSALACSKITNSPISCPAIVWMQGEFNYSAPERSSGLTVGSRPTTEKDPYKSLLVTLKNNMQADVISKYNQTQKPLFITYQTGAQYTVGKTLQIGMAQLEASNENEDIICAGPVYQVTDRGGHLDPNGYRWYGEMLAKAYYKTKIEGKRFIPLQPKLISRTALPNQVKIQFLVPKLPLVLDEKTLAKAIDYGFAVYNNDIRMVISSITIENDCVYLNCAENLDGIVEVNYAGVNQQPNGQGNLRDSDDFEAFYNYIDVDKRNPDNTYFYPRDAAETTLRPTFEPMDATGTVIYDKPYPLYNFCVAFYYKLDVGQQNYLIPILGGDLTTTLNPKMNMSRYKVSQSADYLTVDTGKDQLISLHLIDLRGEIVRVYDANNTRYNINHLNKGVYIAKVKTKIATDTLSIIIK
jgi:autotransporter-associated beta strand protein